MKKVLILAYDFPPYVSVGGLRPYSWFKYFHKFGVHPVVVTRQWGNTYGNYLDYVAPSESKYSIIEESKTGTIIKTPYEPNLSNKILLKHGNNKYVFFRKLLGAFYEYFQWIFFIGPKVNLYYGAKEYLKTNKVDYILATGSPFILFKYASVLSRKFNIKWFADYRDPWSHTSTRSNNILLKWFNQYFEKKCMQNVTSIITVSEFVKQKINLLVKEKSINIIPNGYDKDLADFASNVEQNQEVLSIGFAGTVYNWQPFKTILEVVAKIIHNGHHLELNLYGVNIEKSIKEWIHSDFKNIEPFVKVYPKMKNALLLERLASNNVLLLLNYYSFMGTKIYDYLALKRRILFCFSNDPGSMQLKSKFFPIDEIAGISNSLQEDLIKETNSGIIVENITDLEPVILNLINEHIKNKKISINSHGFEHYSRESQASYYCRLFNAES